MTSSDSIIPPLTDEVLKAWEESKSKFEAETKFRFEKNLSPDTASRGEWTKALKGGRQKGKMKQFAESLLTPNVKIIEESLDVISKLCEATSTVRDPNPL
ncbi:hypothetical protein N7520_001616 [Penicillium odoratum]|uniref:uncharacterized protein n=1 Tax=Penicillium odoratum TaxID=1167516 RepID=UPI002548620A|nr:uncharacterized protein N7520_001616 [Penicillium odoratum]KAJ5778370.1 hypothetical protein N7520_001616 [Penicillium odoratum]